MKLAYLTLKAADGGNQPVAINPCQCIYIEILPGTNNTAVHLSTNEYLVVSEPFDEVAKILEDEGEDE